MVLVTGASGFLGGELVKKLVANGESVRIIRRNNSDLAHLKSIIDKIYHKSQYVNTSFVNNTDKENHFTEEECLKKLQNKKGFLSQEL